MASYVISFIIHISIVHISIVHIIICTYYCIYSFCGGNSSINQSIHCGLFLILNTTDISLHIHY